MSYRVCALTDNGSRSEQNEDAFLVLSHHGFYLVADGVGSGPDGHDASRTLVEMCHQRLIMESISAEDVDTVLLEANHRIYSLANDSGRNGMATTVVAMLLEKDKCALFHAGDSRCYRLRDGILNCLTEDHVKVVRRGDVDKAVVTRVLGVRKERVHECRILDVRQGDRFALMSDGITDVLSPEELFIELMAEGGSLYERCSRLVMKSNQKGGLDDKTVIIIEA